MKISDLHFADSKIVNYCVDVVGKKITFSALDVYNLISGEHIDVVKVSISKWDDVKETKFISDQLFEIKEKITSNIPNESFDLIQEHSVSPDDKLTLSVFSKESGCWMVLEIFNPDIQTHI